MARGKFSANFTLINAEFCTVSFFVVPGSEKFAKMSQLPDAVIVRYFKNAANVRRNVDTLHFV